MAQLNDGDVAGIVTGWKLYFGRNLLSDERSAGMLLVDCERYVRDAGELARWFAEFRDQHADGSLPRWSQFCAYMKERRGAGHLGYRIGAMECCYCADSGYFPLAGRMGLDGRPDVRMAPPEPAWGYVYEFLVPCYCTKGQALSTPRAEWLRLREAWKAYYDGQEGYAHDVRLAWLAPAWSAGRGRADEVPF